MKFDQADVKLIAGLAIWAILILLGVGLVGFAVRLFLWAAFATF